MAGGWDVAVRPILGLWSSDLAEKKNGQDLTTEKWEISSHGLKSGVAHVHKCVHQPKMMKMMMARWW